VNATDVDAPRLTHSESLYKELSSRIKRALSCRRKASPVVNISMPFDYSLFNEGLKLAGVPSKRSRGCQKYAIKHYQDLNHLLGVNWHVRIINEGGDHGYVICETVRFYVRKSRPIVEYITTSDGTLVRNSIDTGYSLIFTFVYNYGSSAALGEDKNVFYTDY